MTTKIFAQIRVSPLNFTYELNISTFGIADHIDEQAIMVEHDRVKSKSF